MPNLTIFFSFKIPVAQAAWDYKFEITFVCPDKKSAFKSCHWNRWCAHTPLAWGAI